MNTSQATAPILHSTESEMIVLGCMLSTGNALKLGCEILNEADFYQTQNRSIFQVMQFAYLQGRACDVHVIAEDLKRQDKLVGCGGVAYLITLAQYAGTSFHVEEYCQDLKRYSAARALSDVASKLHRSVASHEDPFKLLAELQQSIKLIEQGRGLKKKFPIKFINEFDKNFLLVDPPKKPMLLEYSLDGRPVGFLPKGIVAMLVGAGGVGKTHFLSQLALSIATASPFLERFTTTEFCGKDKKGNVFLGLGENQNEDIHRLLYKASESFRTKSPNMLDNTLFEASKRIAAFSFCGQQAAFLENSRPSQYYRELKMRLIEEAPSEGWSMIILDPVSRLLGADAEADNAAATQFIALLEELTIELPGNPTVLFAHHVNKTAISSGGQQNQAAARGSSALTDGVRWQINLAKLNDSNPTAKDVSVLKMTKSNFTAIVEDLQLLKAENGRLYTPPNDAGAHSPNDLIKRYRKV